VKITAPRKRPMMPELMNPPIAPMNTTTIGIFTPRPSRSGLRMLSRGEIRTAYTRNATAVIVSAV
jgi:hypothetical protein